jgi:hypothetical protein
MQARRKNIGSVDLTQMTRTRRRASFSPDPELLDDRPPLRGIGLLESAEGFRRPLLAREKLVPEIDHSRAHRLVVQRLYDSGIEFANSLFRRALGRESPYQGE